MIAVVVEVVEDEALDGTGGANECEGEVDVEVGGCGDIDGGRERKGGNVVGRERGGIDREGSGTGGCF
ncbi:MAG: hypothetical protein U0Z75_06235 [Deinococcaceae bacterium]